ncbi:trans-sulfuration enzyme family protein [Propionispora vibrioides]|uniref:Cystathionine gamma-synthase n=1 Tax=Propionispora vibrioides TaxID=112903 RepID=A0A1H8WIZ0_9FIRM|nr:PLP-dependent transferase [Propionispora vibrioides]SEP27611.1 cystathionine gamma-synthase [Propionispora vibrioides]
MKLSTKIVHCGVGSDPRTGAISTPIYQNATFRHPALGESTGYDYSRSQNPTREAVEKAITDLEGGAAGYVFASGMAAVTAVLLLYKPGSHFIVTEDCYGGTYRVLDQIFANLGFTVSFIDSSNLTEVQESIQKNTAAILIETPTNPLMKIADIKAIACMAAQRDIHTIVDNTFLSPYFQQPLLLGADLVIHSGTKYLSGHNDTVCGAVVARTAELGERIRFIQNSTGSILGPQDSWLLLRGIKTLALRMEKHSANALTIAKWLQTQPQVKQVYYPGLEDHPGKAIQDAQASGYGGMLSFDVACPSLVPQVLSRVRLIQFAESLGGVESLITFPAVQTHADVPPEVRDRLGVSDCLLRFSVGIEDVEDLIEDLQQALHNEG